VRSTVVASRKRGQSDRATIDASCNKETLTMAASKSTRTNQPKPSVTRSGSSETRSQVRNSEVVPRPPVEPGESVEPEDLGAQFLRDATEQDNFESQAPPEEEPAVVVLPHVVISDATLDASMQKDADWLESSATSGSTAEAPREPFQTEVDLTQPTISNASLFDHVVLDEELLDDDAREDVTEEAMTVEPKVHTEDPSDTAPFEEAREREILRIRHELSKKRLQAQEAAKRLEGEWARRRDAEHAAPTRRGQK
jgi:hypothetical protein